MVEIARAFSPGVRAHIYQSGHYASIHRDTTQGLTTMILGSLVVALTLGFSMAAPHSKIFLSFCSLSHKNGAMTLDRALALVSAIVSADLLGILLLPY